MTALTDVLNGAIFVRVPKSSSGPLLALEFAAQVARPIEVKESGEWLYIRVVGFSSKNKIEALVNYINDNS